MHKPRLKSLPLSETPKLVALHDSGMSYGQLAEKYGCSRHAIGERVRGFRDPSRIKPKLVKTPKPIQDLILFSPLYLGGERFDTHDMAGNVNRPEEPTSKALEAMATDGLLTVTVKTSNGKEKPFYSMARHKLSRAPWTPNPQPMHSVTPEWTIGAIA